MGIGMGYDLCNRSVAIQDGQSLPAADLSQVLAEMGFQVSDPNLTHDPNIVMSSHIVNSLFLAPRQAVERSDGKVEFRSPLWTRAQKA